MHNLFTLFNSSSLTDIHFVINYLEFNPFPLWELLCCDSVTVNTRCVCVCETEPDEQVQPVSGFRRTGGGEETDQGGARFRPPSWFTWNPSGRLGQQPSIFKPNKAEWGSGGWIGSFPRNGTKRNLDNTATPRGHLYTTVNVVPFDKCEIVWMFDLVSVTAQAGL